MKCLELLTGKNFVIGTLGSVALWDLVCPDKQTFSEGFDGFIDKHPILSRVAMGYTALHLMNLLPERIDVFHQISKLKKH